MHRNSIVIVFLLILALFAPFNANSLTFPETEEQWSNALYLAPQAQEPAYDSNTNDVHPNRGMTIGKPEGKGVYVGKYNGRASEHRHTSHSFPRAGAVIQFQTNTSKLDRKAKRILDALGRSLNGKLRGAVLRIEGHTDDTGNQTKNVRLSKNRAEAVRAYLIKHWGIRGSRLTTKAYGSRRPLHTNDDSDNRALNRRVEFVRLK